MKQDLRKNSAGNIHRQHDDWDEVHRQSIEVQEQRVQKKSMDVSSPGDADEQEADQVARKIAGGGHAQVTGTVNGAQKIQRASNGEPEKKDIYLGQDVVSAELVDLMGKVIRSYTFKNSGTKTITFEDEIPPGSYILRFTMKDDSKSVWPVNKFPDTVLTLNIHTEIDTEPPSQDYKVTDRISGNGKDLLYQLTDINGQPIVYGEEDDKTGPVFLPEGTQVVKLGDNPQDKNSVKVIVWMNGKYREGYVSKSAFGGAISRDSVFTVDAFMNDAERTLYNSDLTYQNMLAEKKRIDDIMIQDGYPHMATSQSEFIALTKDFRSVTGQVRQAIEDFKNGQLTITPELLKEIRNEDDALQEKNKTDHPGLANHLSGLLFSVRNPSINKKKAQEAITFIPISQQWMESNLNESLKKEWKKQSEFSNLIGNAGYVLSGKNAHDAVVLLRKLQADIKLHKNNYDLGSPETQWVLNTDFSKTEVLIIIENNTWTFGRENSYASEVALNTNFGMLRANPVMTVMAHEMNMVTGYEQANYSMGDTHLGKSETQGSGSAKGSWAEADEGGLAAVSGSGRKMDSLFQAHSSTGILILATYFQRIRAKQ